MYESLREGTSVNMKLLGQGRSEGGIGGWLTPPTFLELKYSENRVGHSENYGNDSVTKF